MNMNDNDDLPRTPSGRRPKSFSDWQDLRRRNPSSYYSAKNTQRMLEDRQTLGAAAFYKKSDDEDDV